MYCRPMLILSMAALTAEAQEPKASRGPADQDRAIAQFAKRGAYFSFDEKGPGRPVVKLELRQDATDDLLASLDVLRSHTRAG
jgi:hypothetical protein